MRKRKRKRRRALWLLAGFLALLSITFFLLAYRIGLPLSSQQAAQRWQGESDLRFSQVSCFLPVDEALQPDKIYAFREEVQKALHAASVDVEYSGQLQVDAWSAVGKLRVSTALGSGEARVIAVGGDFFQFHPLRLLSGNYIAESDYMKDRVLLDEDLAWLLFGGTELTGMELKIEGVPFVVAGVIQREQDRFSRLAYTDGMGLFMSYEAYSQLNDKAGITSYELVMGEPVRGFAVQLAKQKFPIGNGEILQNTDRFSFSRLAKILLAFGTRSMQTRGIIYPYWENACRSAEDHGALYLLLGFLFAEFPFIHLMRNALRLLRRARDTLVDEIIPDMSERIGEAVRVRERRAWEKRHGRHERR